MARPRSDAQQRVADLLRTARSSLGLSVAFLSRLEGDTQYLEVVESSIPIVFRDGITQPRATSFCQTILDGRLPEVIPDVRQFPAAKALPAARFPRIRSYVSVPVVFSDGTLYGTFCAAGLSADRDLQERDRALMEVLAQSAAHIIEPEFAAAQRGREIDGRLLPLIEAGGPQVALQPIVDLSTGAECGAEALSRFPAEWCLPPDLVFEQAAEVGRSTELELLVVQRVAGLLPGRGGYVGVNLSPAAAMDPTTLRLLGSLPLDRLVLELSEHDPVDDYDALHAALAPLRAQGLRLAIDDVGSGFSSLRHILMTAPDVVKLDRSIVAGVAEDPVLRTLVRSLVQFADGLGAGVVAEGIETQDDADALHEQGVSHGQGYLFGRPEIVTD